MASVNEPLYKALGLFIDAFRPYVISLLAKTEGDKWPAEYAQKLGMAQRDSWDKGLRNGTTPDILIDFSNLKSFALGGKDLLKPDFGSKDVNNLPTWLGELADVRHKVAHFSSTNLTEDEVTIAFISMIRIADKTGMTELKDSLKRLQQTDEPTPIAELVTPPTTASLSVLESQQPIVAVPPLTTTLRGTPTAKAWFSVVRPHQDIRQGHLNEAVFAANLAHVAQDQGPEIYRNATLFFDKTYPTSGLKTVAGRVIKGLNGGKILTTGLFRSRLVLEVVKLTRSLACTTLPNWVGWQRSMKPLEPCWPKQVSPHLSRPTSPYSPTLPTTPRRDAPWSRA